MTTVGLWTGGGLMCLIVTLSGPAAAGGAAVPMALSDSQLDGIAVGLAASATGDSFAQGERSSSLAQTLSVVGQPGSSDAAAVGQVSAWASAAAGAISTARASLTLSVAIP